MGNSLSFSEEDNEEFNKFILKYPVEDQKTNVQFDRIAIRSLFNTPLTGNSTDYRIILKNMTLTSEEEVEEILSKIKLKQKKKIKNMTQIMAYNLHNSQKICGSLYSITVAVEYYEKTLLSELRERRKTFKAFPQDRYFTEAEIWYILDGLVNLARDMQDIGLLNELKISPVNLIISDEGLIKLIDGLVLSPIQILNYDYLIPYSPDYLKNMTSKKNYKNTKISVAKEIVWMIGMTTLSAAVCCDIAKFYDLEYGKLQLDVLNKKLLKLKYKVAPYSNQLQDILKKCVETSEASRIDLIELHEFLLPFSAFVPQTPQDGNQFVKTTLKYQHSESIQSWSYKLDP